MFCDKHMNGEDRADDDDSDEDVPLGLYEPQSARATKRVTRFIDLGAGGLGAGPA